MVKLKNTLYDKIFATHVVDEDADMCLIYIDKHLVHEVTSPQAFESLRAAKRGVRRPDCTLATVDHNIPTSSRKNFKDVKTFVKESDSRVQCMTLEANVKEFGLTYFGLDDQRQGIVHVIGPEQGFTVPGSTIVCGDSHTATHGAFGALAFGIGTSEVEHVLATQTLLQKKSKNMRILVEGTLGEGVTSKDMILHIIGVIGTAGGTGHVIEFAGSAVELLSMEARMSVCNMAIEAGARAGMVAPDEITFEYLKDRPLVPTGQEWERAVEYWRSLRSDDGAVYDKEVVIQAADISPTVTWGTSPQDVVAITANVPDPAAESNPSRRAAMERSLTYMGLNANTPMTSIKIDKVFIGSCTNSRIEDLRAAAAVVLALAGKRVAEGVYAMIVPGSGLVKQEAEAMGLDKIFVEAGFDWREAGCSMCLGMNPDQLSPGERCASTSNRNFEGRQGPGGRTHLVSPAMAAAAALCGHLVDIRTILGPESTSDVKAKYLAAHRQITASAAARPSKSFVQATPRPIAPPSPQSASEADSAAAVQSGLAPFKVHTGIAAPFDMANVDTDMIIPKQFLKTIKRTGLGKSCFFEMRYKSSSSSSAPTLEENPDFIMNKPAYRDGKASILITGANFGCGSSREHAPWALLDMGIQVLVATGFADIFWNNCYKNGMLPIVLDQKEVDELMSDARNQSPLTIDLASQTITRSNTNTSIHFEVEPFRKHCLLNGLDDIGITLQKETAIRAYEEKRSHMFPWLDGLGYKKIVVDGIGKGDKPVLEW